MINYKRLSAFLTGRIISWPFGKALADARRITSNKVDTDARVRLMAEYGLGNADPVFTDAFLAATDPQETDIRLLDAICETEGVDYVQNDKGKSLSFLMVGDHQQDTIMQDQDGKFYLGPIAERLEADPSLQWRE